MGEGTRRDLRVRLNERAPHPAKEYTALELAIMAATFVIVALLGPYWMVPIWRAMGLI